MKGRLMLLACLSLVAACADSDLDLDDVPLSELSDEELDAVCEDRVEQLESDRGAHRLFCLAQMPFSDELSCTATVAFCLDEALPQPTVRCGHVPADAVTCDQTPAELRSRCGFTVSVEDAIRATPCRSVPDYLNFISEVNTRRGGPCPTVRDCDFVFFVRLDGFVPDAGMADMLTVEPMQP